MDYACVEFDANVSVRYVEYSTHSVLPAWIPIFCAWSSVLNPAVTTTTRTIYADQFVALSDVNGATIDLKYGNIASFLDQDPYYAETGIGSRYTSVHPFTAVLDEQNCFSVTEGSSITGGVNIQVPLNVTAPEGPIGFTMFFLDATTGRVRGPKSGTMCEYIPVPDPETVCQDGQQTRYGTCLANTANTCPDTAMRVGHTICRSGKLTNTEVCTRVNDMLSRYDTATEPEQKVSPGNLKWFLEDLLQNRVQGSDWDMETFVQRNRTAYASATSDPRDAADGTRSTGILPKCSAPTCFADQFTGSQSKAPQVLHDLMFQVSKIREIVAQYCP